MKFANSFPVNIKLRCRVDTCEVNASKQAGEPVNTAMEAVKKKKAGEGYISSLAEDEDVHALVPFATSAASSDTTRDLIRLRRKNKVLLFSSPETETLATQILQLDKYSTSLIHYLFINVEVNFSAVAYILFYIE